MLFGVFTALAVAWVTVYILNYSKRKRVFSQECLRPPGPLVTDKKQRDEVLKKGELSMVTGLNVVDVARFADILTK